MRLHDIGKLALSNRILDSPGRLTEAEYAKVKEHPVVTERILDRVPGFSELSPLAGAHHERLDGSGYPKGASAESLAAGARILAVCDVVQAMSAARPHRAPLPPERVIEEIESACKRGLLCGDAARWVLESREDGVKTKPLSLPKVLSDREVEVLAELATGKTLTEVAVALGIATKTADNHAQRVYEKIGVTTRAAATLWAVKQGIVRG
jgi:DNA-binding CsgD family transcriptional regulator